MTQDPPTLDLVTVVYRRDLPLLRLQAASIARYLDPAGIGRIVVVVNDIDEAACATAVEALRPAYGAFADRLDVVLPAPLFALRPAARGPRGPGQRLRLWFTRNRRVYPPGVKRGWRGNRGWSVQQALKLAVARHGDSPFLLLLDAKNHFVRPVSHARFVSPDGRARSYRTPPTELYARWIAASFRLLGLPPPPPDAPAPPTVTPVCLPRDLLLGTLDAVEARVGPVEAFFARGRRDTSEFMLIYAHVAGRPGGWEAAFDPGLDPPATIFRDTPSAEIDAVLSRVERGEADILSLHSFRLASLTPAERQRFAAIWTDRGLPADGVFPADAHTRGA